MNKELSPLAPLLDRLHSRSRLRVWSVVVSIFGELVQPRRSAISVQELLALTSAVGIEENALRTALSRLAKEGWVERHKRGRLAYYALSESGRHAFLTASERIYHHAFTSHSPDWYLANFNGPVPKSDKTPATGFTLSRQWQLINSEDVHRVRNDKVLLFKADAVNVPDWAFQQLVPDTITEQYQQLWQDLQGVTTNAATVKDMSPLCAITARVLIIHAWRRLVLRHPLMPQGLLPEHWPGLLCHQQICAAYPRLISPAESWWEDATGDEGLAELDNRFKIT